MNFKKIKDRFNILAADLREKAQEATANVYLTGVLGYVYVRAGIDTVKEKFFPSFQTSLENGDAKAVDAALVKNPALANAALDDRKTSPLLIAAHFDQPAVAAVLLKHGARLDAEDERGITPLLIAATHGSLPMIELFLANNDPTLNKLVFGETQTAASAAATEGHLAALEMLHKAGARLDLTNHWGSSVLIEVNDRIKFSGGRDLVGVKQCFDYLARNMAEVSPAPAADANVYTQLMRVASQGDVELAQLILTGGTAGAVNQRFVTEEKAVPVHGIDETKHVVNTALKEAVGRRELAMVDLMLKNGAKQDIDYEGDETPLMIAARNGRADMLKLLLDNDTSTINLVHLRKFDGFLDPERVDFTHSALTYAVKSKKLDVVTLLLDHGARTDLPTTKSPLQLAQQLGLTEIADLLTARQSVNKAPDAKPPTP